MKDLKEMPKWIKNIGEHKFEITIKDKVYIFEEQKGSVIEECQELEENTNKKMQTLLISRSSYDPKLSDDDVSDLRGETYLKLQMAIVYIYGFNDFL